MSYFHDVREDVRAGAHAPDLEAIHRIANKRRRTRRAIASGVTVVALAAGSYALVRPHQQPAASDGPVHGPIQAAAVPVTKDMRLAALYPLSPQVTYAVAGLPDGGYAVVRTTDGGQTWHAWALPKELLANRNQHTLISDVVAPSELLGRMQDPAFLTNLSFTVNDYLTRDGGESWRKIAADHALTVDAFTPTTAVGADVPSVPEGWLLGLARIDSARWSRLAAVDPATGIWHGLASAPAHISAVNMGPDGSIWTITYNETSTDSGVAVSHDRGRTWLSRTLPHSEGSLGNPLIGTDSTHATADVFVPESPSYGGLKHSYTLATSDGGKTWTKRIGDRSLPAGAMLLPDGSILGYNTAYVACWDPSTKVDTLIVTADGGKTCRPVAGTANAGRLAHTINGTYVLSDSNVNPTGYRMSTDGLDWRPAPRPPIG